MKTYKVRRLSDRLTQFDDPITSTCYLLEGSERNLLIDTGTGDPEEFRELLQPFRTKPLLLAITHAHADHYANAGLEGLFETVYLHHFDIALLPFFNEYFAMAMAEQGRSFTPEQATPIHGGDSIDLGDIQVEVLPLPGHSPGSVCFYVPKLGLLFTGDAVGSGGEFWMQLPHCLPIATYRKHLESFLDSFPKGDIRLLGGHSSQAGEAGSPDYAPMNRERVEELLRLCRKLEEKDPTVSVRDYGNEAFPGAMLAQEGKAQIVYLPDRIR